MPNAGFLFPTKHRKALLRAVEGGDVIRYHSTGDAWDNLAGTQVSARLYEAFNAGWVEPIPENELPPGAHPKTICTYYRLTDAGKRVLGLATNSIEKEQGNG